MNTNVGIFYRKKPVFGLDIGASSAKIVQLAKHGNTVKLEGYGRASIPAGILTEGIIFYPEKLGTIIKDLLGSVQWGKITAGRVALGLPEAKIFTRILNVPNIKERELDEAVRWETEQYIPVPITDLYIDYQVINSSEDGHQVLLVAAPKTIVDSYLQLLDVLGLEPHSIEMSLSAIVRAMISSQKEPKATMVIDVGGVASDVCIYDRRIIQLTGSIPIGGSQLSQAIATELGEGIRKSEEIKTEYGLSESPYKDKITRATMLPINSLVQEVKRISKFYESRGDEKPDQKTPLQKIEQIIITGGGASMPGITEHLSKLLDVSVVLGNPWANISTYPIKPVSKAEAPRYTTAIGLALRGFDDD